MVMPMATIITTTPIMGITMTEGELFDLMTWMSPAWPIGAFAHSSGLEWAVEDGLVRDRLTTFEWIAAMLDHGALRNDVVVFVHSWRATVAQDGAALRDIAELGAATLTSHERRVESCAQGAAFRRIALAAAHSSPGSEDKFPGLLAAIPEDQLSYPVAAAVLFAARGVALRPGLTAWLHGAAANLVSAAQRLVPLGQTDGQCVLRDLKAPVIAAAQAGCILPEGDPFEAIGGCTLVSDIACMAHETQYTRLFRT